VSSWGRLPGSGTGAPGVIAGTSKNCAKRRTNADVCSFRIFARSAGGVAAVIGLVPTLANAGTASG
jgi:hypothetical protein